MKPIRLKLKDNGKLIMRSKAERHEKSSYCGLISTDEGNIPLLFAHLLDELPKKKQLIFKDKPVSTWPLNISYTTDTSVTTKLLRWKMGLSWVILRETNQRHSRSAIASRDKRDQKVVISMTFSYSYCVFPNLDKGENLLGSQQLWCEYTLSHEQGF